MNNSQKNNIKYITSIDIPELDIFSKASEPQLVHYYEPEEGLFIVESPEVISRAVSAGYDPIAVLTEGRYLETSDFSLIKSCPNIYVADIEEMVKITGFNLTRGLLAAFRRKPFEPISDFLKGKKRIAILENVVNPTNIGAIFRSAAAMYADGIILTPDCSDPLYRRASRVSMGNVFQVPWTYFPGSADDWYNEGPNLIKNHGFSLIATALCDTSIPINDSQIIASEKLAVFLGSEGFGLKDSTIESCDFKTIIPMSNNVDSLNVAAASAVVFWELFAKPSLSPKQ